jgi:hypothetical protein
VQIAASAFSAYIRSSGTSLLIVPFGAIEFVEGNLMGPGRSFLIPFINRDSEEKMRTILTIASFLIIALALVIPSTVQADKEVTLAGKITCAKCELKIEKECATVIVVKENGKGTVYYFDQKSHKANHDAVCQVGKEGTVTGTVSEKAGKKYIAVTKIAFTK